MDKNLKEVVNKVAEEFEPISIFLYGSRAREDYEDFSDFEVGVLYTEDKDVSRRKLAELNPYKNIGLYPFEVEDFQNYKLDAPFPKSIHYWELIKAGKTIYGEKVVEGMDLPPITLVDLLNAVSFETAYALASVISYRHGDKPSAKLKLTKSALFGLRCLIIFKKKEFPVSYDEIYKATKTLDLEEEHSEVAKLAFKLRKGAKVDEGLLFKNLSMLNTYIFEELKKEYEENGDRVILENSIQNKR